MIGPGWAPLRGTGPASRPFAPQNALNALGRAAFLQSRCPERPRSSRPARPPFMSANRAACRPQNRRPEDLRTPRPLASQRPEPLGARRPASFTEPPTGRSTRTLLDVSPGVASVPTPSPLALPGMGRDESLRSAAPRGMGRDEALRSAASPRMGRDESLRSAASPRMGRDESLRSAASPRMGRDESLRSAAPRGMGRDAPSKLVRSPRTPPYASSQPLRGIFETASSFAGELTDKGREPSPQDLAEGRGFSSGRPADRRGLASVPVLLAVSAPVPLVSQSLGAGRF
jgi:hypothetical protein